MNTLSLLLAATAVLLAAAAFLKSMGARASAVSEDASHADSALQEILGRLGDEMRAIRESLLVLPSTQETMSNGFAATASLLESQLESSRALGLATERLPGAIAQAAASSDVLAELRALRTATTAVVDRVSGLQIEIQSSGKSRDEGMSSAKDAIASIAGPVGQKLSALESGLVRVAEILAEESARSGDQARSDALRMEALSSSFSSLPEKLDAIASVLGTLDASHAVLEQTRILSDLQATLAAHGGLLADSRALQEAISRGIESLGKSPTTDASAELEAASRRERENAEVATQRALLLEEVSSLSSLLVGIREAVDTLPVRTAEEVAARPAPAPELEELAIAVRDAGSLRGDSVRSIADAVSRVAQRLEEASQQGSEAREDAARRLADSLGALETVSSGIREALLPLGDALRGHGEAVIPVVRGLELAQDRLEEAGVSLRANQVEFAASVGVFSNAAQDLSTGLGAFAREGAEDGLRDPAAAQTALLEALDRLLGGFSDSLRATLVDADLRHREALAEIAARLPGSLPG